MAFSTWFVNMAIAPTYILCKIGMETKRYEIKNSIANITNLVTHQMQLLY
jgi:hypothetical protein